MPDAPPTPDLPKTINGVGFVAAVGIAAVIVAAGVRAIGRSVTGRPAPVQAYAPEPSEDEDDDE